MRTTFLESAEDLAWVSDVHKVPTTGIACVILYGNEDCPERIDAYTVNHIDCVPLTYRANDDGELRLAFTHPCNT